MNCSKCGNKIRDIRIDDAKIISQRGLSAIISVVVRGICIHATETCETTKELTKAIQFEGLQ